MATEKIRVVKRTFDAAPSLMCANLVDLSRDLDLFAKNHVELLHMDIMDGHYVPNVALGPQLCSQIAKSGCPIPQDIHLMVEEADRFVPLFAEIEPKYISFHPETSRHPMRTVQSIRAQGSKPGIAIDPALPLDMVRHLLPEVDLVCVMTVSPGYAGQALIPWAIDKIRDLTTIRAREKLTFTIEVDGNASWDNIPVMVNAGAQIIVLGTSSLFQAGSDLEEMLLRTNDLL